MEEALDLSFDRLLMMMMMMMIVTRSIAGKFFVLKSVRSDNDVHFICNFFKYSCTYIEFNFVLKY